MPEAAIDEHRNLLSRKRHVRRAADSAQRRDVLAKPKTPSMELGAKRSLNATLRAVAEHYLPGGWR